MDSGAKRSCQIRSLRSNSSIDKLFGLPMKTCSIAGSDSNEVAPNIELLVGIVLQPSKVRSVTVSL